MANIQFIEHSTNKELCKQSMDSIPRVGEYMILSQHIEADWKKVFHIVRAVSYTLGGDVIVHVEYYDIDKEAEKERRFREQLEELRVKPDGI